MPEKFSCYEFPCKGGLENEDTNTGITCFVANSIQRSAFININFFMTCVTILMSFMDLYTIGFKSVAQGQGFQRGTKSPIRNKTESTVRSYQITALLKYQ